MESERIGVALGNMADADLRRVRAVYIVRNFRKYWRGACIISTVWLMVTLWVVRPAQTRFRLLDDEDFSLEMGGFVSEFSGIQHLPYDTAGLSDDISGINGLVFRVEWTGAVGSWLSYEVHNRIFYTLNSVTTSGLSVGLGATVPPERTVDLRSKIVDKGNLLLEHDLDRLALRFYTGPVDLILGRQAITWGNALLFTPSDIWTQFSPFELDTSQKRGVDAARALFYPGADIEADVVVVDRGRWEDLSGGARVGITGASADYFVYAAKNWQKLLVWAGASVDFKVVKARLEAGLPVDMAEEFDVELPQATLGVDYFSGDVQISAEYHFNGPGADSSDAYLEELQSPALQRGERYVLGQHYLGTLVSYLPIPDITLALAALVNVVDPSAILTPSFQYALTQNVTLTLGAFQGIGAYPNVTVMTTIPQFEIESEYGTYGGVYYLQLSAYF